MKRARVDTQTQTEDLPFAEGLYPGCDGADPDGQDQPGQRGGHSRKQKKRRRGPSHITDPRGLTAESVNAWNVALLNVHKRVKAYTVTGQQCCIAGYADLSFPGKTLVMKLLNTDIKWVQKASPEEEAATGKWYTWLPFVPKAIIHCTGSVASPREMLGTYGNTITVLAQASASIQCDNSQKITAMTSKWTVAC